MKNASLKRTLQLTVMVMIILIGFAISQFVIQQYSNALMESAKAKAENISHKLAVNSADFILINDLVSLQKELDSQLVTTPSVAYIFIEKDSEVLAHTFKEGIPKGLIQFNKPISNTHGRIKKIQTEKREKIFDIAWPIFDGNAGTVRLGLSEKPYEDKVKQLWFKMSIITAAIIVIALIVVHFLLVYLTRPLSVLASKVTQIDEGNLDTPIDIRGRQEVAKLTSAFNHMLARLKDYTRRLNESNRELLEKNQALERAHKQLSSSVAISKEIAGLPKLQDICAYLLSTFREILTCQQMVFLTISPLQKLYLVTDHDKTEFGESEYHKVYPFLNDLTSYRYFETETFSYLHLPAKISASKLAVFPLRGNSELLGVLIVGCRDHCICKPEELTVVQPILNQSMGAFQRSLALEEELGKLNQKVEKANNFHGLIGKDSKMQMIFKLIENIASTDTSVLIQGESGTGKELVADAIHICSHRKEKPFTIINCSAYPATLLESELFGHEKGAFTGATRRKAGRFEQADGGTVFLDEIGEISQSAQIKLLRVLQSRKFERLGGEQTLSVNVRILAATNKDLAREVQTGNFREDLYYRLNVIPVNLPPLRERKNDIFLLAKHFLNRFANEQKKKVNDYSSEVMHYLTEYHWPGNVRELENTIEHAVVLAKDPTINVLDLPPSIKEYLPPDNKPKVTRLSDSEKDLIKKTLEACDWNKSKAAEKMGISRGTLYQKLKKYSIYN